VLDTLGRPQEASLALNQGFQAAPTRADLYYQGALFLLKHDQAGEAHRLIEQALRVVPDSPELLLIQAITLELLKTPEEAKKLLVKIQSRWPEWGLPYLIHGMILEIHLFSEEAKTS
jgi:tetratricopeptide (TPR) repeat protein